jgi:hypothetical protein
MYHVVFLARILFLGESRIISLIEPVVSAFGSVGVLSHKCSAEAPNLPDDADH